MSGFVLQVPADVLAPAKAAAAEEHVSIDQLLVGLISEGLGHRRGLRDLQQRAARANVAGRCAFWTVRLMRRPKKGMNCRGEGSAYLTGRRVAVSVVLAVGGGVDNRIWHGADPGQSWYRCLWQEGDYGRYRTKVGLRHAAGRGGGSAS
jgi:hypothetical protein